VVAVGGVDANFQQAYFANSGQGLDVTAPAVGIQSAYGPDSIVVGDGTPSCRHRLRRGGLWFVERLYHYQWRCRLAET